MDDRGRNAIVGDAWSAVCARLTFFVGGCGGEESAAVAALAMEGR